ncbi:hypothetical protein ALNOE001_21360 [Candidatus Methanobinarius endosymbioticus]|uniref:Glycerophosphoryl diester phosphodiesterase membrane domain-containing protein n=1 Tax=Candidatus Methanobinarius endosymbioticus TaxID=2006182 RepID=A0A366MA06_9EURY|nr:hypothetical protein ALNOE001_21360 [Candidatus Methanobinarius endosymbioticus]
MNIKEMFHDSLSYPIKDIDKLLTLGVLFFFDAILSLLPSITVALNQTIATQILYFLSNIVGIIIMIIAGGYLLSIIKNTIQNNNSINKDSVEDKTSPKNEKSHEIPSIKITKNLFNGIKIAIVSILYYTISMILTIILAYLNGTVNFILRLVYSYMYFGPEITANSLLYFDTGNILITLIIGNILFLITSLILVIALARLADTGSVKSALSIKKVFSDISKIKLLNYISYSIIFVLILVIISIIAGSIVVIPFIGIIILFLLIMPFIIMFFGRTLGLIYKKSKINMENNMK